MTQKKKTRPDRICLDHIDQGSEHHEKAISTLNNRTIFFNCFIYILVLLYRSINMIVNNVDTISITVLKNFE